MESGIGERRGGGQETGEALGIKERVWEWMSKWAGRTRACDLRASLRF